MVLFYEILPVILFFIAFKLYDIYIATVVGIVTTFIQLITTRLLKKQWDKKQIITFTIFCVFGGMTLYFHNPIFVKWKVTIVYWIFALVILGSNYIGKRPLMQSLMEHIIDGQAPHLVWRRINFMWGLFFTIMGALNLYIAYYFSDSTWVNFKLYGLVGALFLFSIVQSFYLFKYISTESGQKKHE